MVDRRGMDLGEQRMYVNGMLVAVETTDHPHTMKA